jgi:hypothetical protein
MSAQKLHPTFKIEFLDPGIRAFSFIFGWEKEGSHNL